MTYTLINFIKDQDYFTVAKIIRKNKNNSNFDINYQDEEYKCTLVQTSIIHCDKSNISRFINLLIECKPNLNIKNASGFTALHLCFIFNVNIDIIRILLENGADPTIEDKYNNTALHHAIKNSRKDAFILLFQHNCKLDKKAKRLSNECGCYWDLWKSRYTFRFSSGSKSSKSSINNGNGSNGNSESSVYVPERIKERERVKNKKEDKYKKKKEREKEREKEEKKRESIKKKEELKREKEMKKIDKQKKKIEEEQRKLDEKRYKLDNEISRLSNDIQLSYSNSDNRSVSTNNSLFSFNSSSKISKSSKGNSSISSGIRVLPPEIVRDRPRPNLRNLQHRQPRATVI